MDQRRLKFLNSITFLPSILSLSLSDCLADPDSAAARLQATGEIHSFQGKGGGDLFVRQTHPVIRLEKPASLSLSLALPISTLTLSHVSLSLSCFAVLFFFPAGN